MKTYLTGDSFSSRNHERDMKAVNRFESATFGLLIASGVLGIYLAARSILHVGIGWDTDIDTYASIQVRSLPDSISLDEAANQVISTSEHYGILIQVLADFLHRLSGSSITSESGWLDTYQGSDWSERFKWQAVVTLTLAVIATAILSQVTFLLSKSRLTGATVWALLLSLPTFLGLAIVNFKDLPVSSGITIVCCALALLMAQPIKASRVVTSCGLFGFGASISLGVRAGSWPLILGISFFVALSVGLVAKNYSRQTILRNIFVVTVLGFAISFIFLFLLNPFARIDLISWLLDSAVIMNRYPHIVETLTLGSMIPSQEIPWWYFPSWFAAQVPLVALFLIFIGLILFVLKFFKIRSSTPENNLLWLLPFIAVVFMAIAIPLSGSTLYDGIRQLSFATPSIITIATIGLMQLQTSKTFNRSIGHVVTAMLVIAVGLNLLAIAQWSPYMYGYLNPLAQPRNAERRWEIDYWGVSAQEGVSRLRELGFSSVTARPTPRTSTMVGSVDEHYIKGSFGMYQFLIRRDSQIPAECEELFRIKRDGLTLGIGAKCPKSGLDE